MVAEFSVDSITIANKLTKALETITMQQSTINDQSSTNSSLNTQLMLANATVMSMNVINEGLESDVAYLVNRQKYSALVANKLKKANETILNLQASIQSLNSHSTQNDRKNELQRQRIEIASLRFQLHASLRVQLHASSPPSPSSSSSQIVASSLPPTSYSIITPSNRRRTIEEADELTVHNNNDGPHSRLQHHTPVSIIPFIDLTGSAQQFSSFPSSSLPPLSSSSSSSPVGTKNFENETDYPGAVPTKQPESGRAYDSTRRLRETPSASTAAPPNQRR
jgi:hypothetical protein